MKLAVIFSVFFVQASASFFSDLSNSVSSMGSSIGKLFSDAAVDLKDTFDCTVFAVRQAFSGDSSLPGYEKCQPNVTPLSTSKPIQIIISPIVIPTTEAATTSPPTSKEVKSLKFAIETSNNNTKGDEIVKKQSHGAEILDETQLIVNISTKLEREFKELSRSVKDDLTKIEQEQKQLSMDKLIKEIDKLLQEDAIYKNNTNSEIREISDKITAKLENNNTDKIDFKEEIKLAIAEIEKNKNQTNVEQDLIKWKEEELKDLNDIRNLLKKQQAGKVINKRTIQTEATTTKPTSTTLSTTPMTSTTVPTPKVSTKPRRKRPKPTKMPNTRTTKPSSTKPPNDYDNLETTDKAALDLARKLVDSSKKSEAIMAAILKNEKSATSIFDR